MAGACCVQSTDDLGASWRAAGRSCPSRATKVRGIASNAEVKILVVSSNSCCVYRSEDGGETWGAQGGQPSEGGAARPHSADTNVLYAVYSI